MQRKGELSPLDRAAPGRYTVDSVAGGRGLLKKLSAMGISSGVVIEVLGRSPEGAPRGGFRGWSARGRGGPVEVAAGGGRFLLGRGMAARILVETRSSGGPLQDVRPHAARPAGETPKGVVTLREYREGQRGRVLEVRGEGKFRKRLLEMGFVKGTEVYVEKYAPLLDPVEYVVKGYHVSLRRDEAEKIVMSEPE